MHVVLIEPFHHRPGHFSEEVGHLGRALHAAGARVEVITLLGSRLDGLTSRAAAELSGLGRLARWLGKGWSRAGGTVRAVVDTLSILLCLRVAVGMAKPNSVMVCVSGRFLAFFLAAAMTRKRAWVYFSRDFSNCQRPSLLDRLLNGPTRWLAHRAGHRNQVCLISTVNPESATPEDSFGLPMVYIPPAGIVTCPPVVPREARRRLELPEDVPLLLVFGLAYAGKEYEVIFAALEHLRLPLKIVFAGSVPSNYPQHPRRLKKLWDKQDRVIVRDLWIPTPEVPLYFSAADGLLLSYREGYVVDSGVLCQGVAMNRPMLGNQEGSIGHNLSRWPLGLTFPAGDPVTLARQMEALVHLDERQAELFAAGREAFARRHSWESIARQHLELYERLLGPK